MDQPRQFGDFLLFRESETNAYRTSYRAGVARGRTIDRVVRLEVFDGPEIDAGRLRASLRDSSNLQARIKDPHIVTGAGLGDVGGVPYAVYDFELGTTLATFLDVARDKSFPVPLDQALFIAERIALALAAAHQVEHNGRPVLHSFLTPDSVVLSNEGGVKVLGFETGPGLREQLAAKAAHEPYLAPECRAGEAAAAQDDVYSLGSILFELISGTPRAGTGAGTDDLVVRATGEPVSESLSRLLEGSFAPRAQRIANVLAWQQELGRLILNGEYNPTTFNLAFLMHTIMRDRLERDLQELKQEKRFLLTEENPPAAESGSRTGPTAVIAAEPSTPGHARSEKSSLSRSVSSVTSALAPEGADPGRKTFWLGFAVSAVVGSIVLGTLVVSGPNRSLDAMPEAPLASTAATQTEPDDRHTAVGAPARPAEPAPAEALPDPDPATVVLTDVVNGDLGQPGIDTDEIERLVAQRALEIEQDLKAEYERRLETLRTAAELAARPPAADAAAPSQKDGAIDGVVAATGHGRGDGGPTASPGTRQLPQAAGVTLSSTPADHGIGPSDEPRPTESERPEAASLVAERSPEVASEPASAADVRTLDEIGPAPAPATPVEPVITVPPKLLRLGRQTYPPVARKLGLAARVRVRARIGVDGIVQEAVVVGAAAGHGFDEAALRSVRSSRWQPASEDGVPVETWTSLTVDFQL